MSKEDWEKNTIKNIFSGENLWPWKDGSVGTVLDVACGLSLKSKFIPADIRVGVDIYDKYFDHIESNVPYVVIKHDVTKLEEIFTPKSFDVVIALDIVEHLEKDDSLKMIKMLEKIARKAVIIETPKGFVPQNIDILGHGGDEFQTHRCGWEVEEFNDMGYHTVVRDYVMKDIQRHTDMNVDNNIQLIDAIKFLD